MAEIRQQNTGWRLDWRELPPHARWVWWEQLWADAVRLRDRYRLALRAGWWRDDIQVEALAAVAALVGGYYTGAWNDPVAKLQLLFDLDRFRELLRAGDDVFDALSNTKSRVPLSLGALPVIQPGCAAFCGWRTRLRRR